MLQSILDLAAKVLDLFTARSRQIEEWAKARLDSIRAETARKDSGQAREDYNELERRAREGKTDGS